MELAERIKAEVRGEIKEDEPLAKHTSFRIGGPAALWVEPESQRDLAVLLGIMADHPTPWVVLGEGTNLLVSDQGYSGVVISLGAAFTSLDFQEERVEAGAAVRMRDLLREASERALGGLVFAAGVPGTVGGACATNAGTAEEAMGDRIIEVNLMRRDQVVKKQAEEMEFSYRHSSLRGEGVILRATLQLVGGEKDHIKAELARRQSERRQRQPLGLPSAGSVFKNPPGLSAGKLISDCGLGGQREGEAEISELHANFIVNRGKARARDVARLMERMEREVERRFEISMKREIELVGFSCE